MEQKAREKERRQKEKEEWKAQKAALQASMTEEERAAHKLNNQVRQMHRGRSCRGLPLHMYASPSLKMARERRACPGNGLFGPVHALHLQIGIPDFAAQARAGCATVVGAPPISGWRAFALVIAVTEALTWPQKALRGWSPTAAHRCTGQSGGAPPGSPGEG